MGKSNVTSLSVRRFLSCFVGSGKTTDSYTVIEKHLRDGERVCVVTDSINKFSLQSWLRTKLCGDFDDKVTIVMIEDLLKKFSKFTVKDTDDSPAYDEKDPSWVSFRKIPELKGFDRVFLCHEAYNYIIRTLIGKLDAVADDWRRIG